MNIQMAYLDSAIEDCACATEWSKTEFAAEGSRAASRPTSGQATMALLRVGSAIRAMTSNDSLTKFPLKRKEPAHCAGSGDHRSRVAGARFHLRNTRAAAWYPLRKPMRGGIRRRAAWYRILTGCDRCDRPM